MKMLATAVLVTWSFASVFAEEEMPQITPRDVLHMLRIDYAKWVISGAPGKEVVLKMSGNQMSAREWIAFPFGKGDKIELLLWLNREDSPRAKTTIYYRLTSVDGVRSDSFQIDPNLRTIGKKKKIEHARVVFGEFAGKMDVGGGTGFLYSGDGRLLGELFLEIR